MRPSCVVFFVLTACSGQEAAERSWSITVEPPADAERVIEAVRSLPECDGMPRGGDLRWRATDFTCRDIRVVGCAFPFEDPPRVEVVYRNSAWDTALAHELCHVCGYLDETEADACALRAKRLRPEVAP